ncbi:enoyl-CoA hydratase/isomerase family protein [Ottowia thiooxydans]|uniref:enoyl-CoA hydratase/isomerase family protein n=1 Tax=Ottowia thiooxydans TaxID=219182 RepID=UPI00040D8312|nr:enoyl-CoA hydratase/isomerase family protein [Ottowia thiooxydans]
MKQKVDVFRNDDVVVLTMDAGGRPTCVDIGMCEALLEALARAASDESVRAVLLRSTGRVFSAGGDLFAIEGYLPDPDRLLAPLIDRFHEVILAMRALPIPVVAQVHGAAAGAGLSLMLACDLVVATRSSKLVAGYPSIGTSSDGGLTFQLGRRLGAAQAMAIFLMEDYIPADRAKELGLIQQLVEDDQIERTAMEAARALAARSPQAVREIKALIREATDVGIADHLALERAAFLRCSKTPDFSRLVKKFTSHARCKEAI